MLRASFLYHCVAYKQGFQNILGLYMIWKGSDVKNRDGRQKKAKKRLFFMTIFSVTLPKLGRKYVKKVSECLNFVHFGKVILLGP